MNVRGLERSLGAKVVIIEDSGHTGSQTIRSAIRKALDGFAGQA